jgi:hypothetical protein
MDADAADEDASGGTKLGGEGEAEDQWRWSQSCKGVVEEGD